jgi:hypothetical protein
MKLNNLSFKVDDDNDIYELTVNDQSYDIYTVYESPFAELFDNLNILIDLELEFDM